MKYDKELIIHSYGIINNNNVYILRDDLLPFSFGGNKLRKAEYFFNDIINNKADVVVTYGSYSSNHVRIISNMAYQNNLKCVVITSEETKNESYNFKILKMIKTELIVVKTKDVNQTINETLKKLSKEGNKPYFIEGGGHGNLGTKAYYNLFKELVLYERKRGIKFNYIFFASGTGTTQAGLILGNEFTNSKKQIIGISIARTKERLTEVISESILEYIKYENLNISNNLAINVIDDYVLGGYSKYNDDIIRIIKDAYYSKGVPLDPTYTGKAMWGMNDYIAKSRIKNKNILFIHTGGTPIFFDFLKSIGDNYYEK